MFNSPNDTSHIYARSEEVCETPFGGVEKVQTEACLSKEYSEEIISGIKPHIQGLIECNYLGCLERIAREVYKIIIQDNRYEVAFVFDKHEEHIIQLHVEIKSVPIEDQDFEKRYDTQLEVLKLAIKNYLIKNWKVCTWLTDDQSEMLCSDLYPRFFKIENKVRAFANKVLIHHLGFDWINQPGLEKYKESTSKMEITFKQTVPQFANINSSLLSTTLETLSEIMQKATIYEDLTTLNSMDVKRLYQLLDNRNEDGIREVIKKRRQVKTKVWDEILIQYLDDQEQFRKQLSQFIKDRNHVAHNKLLTFSAFKKMHVDLTDFEATITKALALFEDKNASEELLNTWMYEQEQEDYDEDYEKQYWRDRIASETGVEIRDKDEIYELFCETVMNLCESLLDKYHFDPCFDVSAGEQPAEDGKTKVCTVTSNSSGDELEIIVSMSLDEDMDSTSYMNIKAIHNGNTVACAECTYYNGEGHEGEEGECVADSDSEYDDSQISDFIEEVFSYINDELNSNLKELFALEYECGRRGGSNPVADFACAECGKNGVSILEDFLPKGKCCYCGYENEVYTCECCGSVYDEMGGDRHLCNGCQPKDD